MTDDESTVTQTAANPRVVRPANALGEEDAHGNGHDDGHGSAHGHLDEALGPVDIVAWGAGVLGVAIGLATALCFALATGLLTA